MIATLAQLRHHVRLAFGNSEISQGQEEWAEPVVGIGQENRASAQIWVAVSTPLFEILHEEGFVVTFICALSKAQWCMAGFAFVDNTNLIVMDITQDERAVMSKMQQSLNLWHGLLKATGGDLVPDKCFWYLINFTWVKDRWQYAKWKDQERTLSIPSSDGTKIMIPRLDTSKARRTLGVWLAPDGNNQAEYQHLRDETLRWKNHMITSNLPWAAADFSIRHVLLPNYATR